MPPRRPSPLPRGAASPRVLLLALAMVGPTLAPGAGSAQAVPFPVEIEGPARPTEDAVTRYTAILPDRPVRVDPAGLSPSVTADAGGAMPVVWEGPVTLVWDFGDGSPAVEVRELTSVSHIWEDDGDYTVALTVRDARGTLARTSREVTVRNRDPRITRAAVVEVDPSTQTVEFTASAVDARDDPLLYRWDFGDGAGTEGEDLWRVQHRYRQVGDYEAVVTYLDGDGGVAADTVDVTVTGVTVAEDDRVDLEPGVEPEAVFSGFQADLSGAVTASFQGGMRSFAGLHLSPVRDGVCRFMFTAWDDALLGYAMAIIDLRGIPDGGARYTIDGDWLSLVLEADAETYRYTRDRGALGMFNQRGLGGMVRALTGGLSDLLPGAERSRMVDTLGVDPAAPERNEPPRPMPAASPFGLEDREGFETVSGTLELTFVPGERATGTYDITLRNTSSEPPPGLEVIRMTGTFALDLQAARREGMVNYGGCAPAELEITAHYPEDGDRHFYTLRPPARVAFDRSVDPATLDAERVQIAYPAASSGDFVPVGARILRDRRRVWLVPEEDLQPGARYTLRVKTGEDGVRGRDGSKLPDLDGTGWWTAEFETMVDLVPAGGPALRLAACNLFQTARDAPLVPGKPAVARVTALWMPPVGVHPSAHVTDFQARVVVRGGGNTELASTVHRFVRPDLWGARGVDRARAEHTAQVYGFTPDPDAHPAFAVGIEVETRDGERTIRYWASCPTEYWDLTPVVTVDYFALTAGGWEDDPQELQATLPVLQNLVAEAEAYATQLFPVAEIRGSAIQVVPMEGDQRPPPGCNSTCIGSALRAELRARSNADIVVGFLPHDLRAEDDPTRNSTWTGLSGGNTSDRLPSGQGVVVSLAGRSTAYFPRYVFALVHELGHVFDLEHIPSVSATERERASALRTGSAPIQYRGIEGFRLTPAGDAGWNKSSVEGNEEGAWLAPLMYPSTIPAPEAFIANHHYRQVQGLFERLGWSRNR